MKLTQILIGLMVAIVVLTGFMTLYSDGATEYEVTGYEVSALNNITAKLEEINSISLETKERIENVKANPLIPDTLGVLLVGGIGALKTALSSVDTFIDITFIGADFLPLGDNSDTVILVIVTSLVIIFFIGILAHYIRPSDRL